MSQNLTEKGRNLNIELLRIISMLMIIAHHLVVHSSSPLLSSLWTNDPLKILIHQSFWLSGRVGVAIFVLITGYFLVNKTSKVSSALKLIVKTFIYSVAVYIAARFIFNFEHVSHKLTGVLVPITSTTYWFISCYLGLYILAPFINKLIFALNQKQHLILIIILSLEFLIPSNYKVFEFYPLLVFIYLYLIGAYLRLYDLKLSLKKSLLCLFLVFILSLLIFTYLNFKHIEKDTLYDFSKLCSLQNPLVVLLAVFFLMAFLRLKLQKLSFIGTISSSVFSVYLIHDNPAFRYGLWHQLLNIREHFLEDPSYSYLGYALLVIISIFSLCCLFDLILSMLLKRPFAKLNSLCLGLDKKCEAFFR